MPDDTPGTPETEPTETVEEQQNEAAESTDEGTTPTEPVKLPDDHPLVKAYEAQKNEIRALKQAGGAEKLQGVTAELDAANENLTSLQKRYDRLEEFLTKSNTPVGKALDSRSFSTKLFESEDPIEDLVKAWFTENPTKTNVALGSSESSPGPKKPSMNDLLRSAIK